MALVKCSECGNSVSDTAKACPQCGAKPKKKVGFAGWIIAAITLLFIVRCTTINSERDQRIAAAEAAKSQEQRSAEAKAKAEAEKRHQAAARALIAIKKSLRDPDSVQWDEILVSDDSSTICIGYRAKNGFGGYSRGHIALFNGTASDTAEAWNKHCAGKRMNDHRLAAKAI